MIGPLLGARRTLSFPSSKRTLAETLVPGKCREFGPSPTLMNATETAVGLSAPRRCLHRSHREEQRHERSRPLWLLRLTGGVNAGRAEEGTVRPMPIALAEVCRNSLAARRFPDPAAGQA